MFVQFGEFKKKLSGCWIYISCILLVSNEDVYLVVDMFGSPNLKIV